MTIFDSLQIKMDLRQAAIEKLELKVNGCDQQITVMTNAKTRYQDEIARKRAGLEAMEKLRETVVQNEARVTELKRLIAARMAVPFEFDPSTMSMSDMPTQQADFKSWTAELKRLETIATPEYAEKEANKIYYGKA